MRTLKTVLLAITGAVLVGLVPAVGAGRFDLNVNDISGVDEPWPLVGGLPFSEGELRDASRIRIVDAQGNEVPAQVDVAATWRDGSIRWALAGFTASPQGEYRVEYGPGVSRAVPEHPLVVDETADGVIRVDTGAAVYEFDPDTLLPASGRMGDTVFLADAGDGAYLVDNQGRLSRVAGARAEVETEIVKRGPMRAVVRREGWYVTGDGERVARAKVWFYFAAGVPVLRVTHSLVFTEDTNELWVRDYGLEFRTPKAPEQVVFAHREADEPEKQEAMAGVKLERHELRDEFPEMFSGNRRRDWDSFTSRPDGQELYMIQDVYPHLLEREFRAVIGCASPSKKAPVGGLKTGADNLWLEDWEQKMEVAGDWGDGRYQDYALTVVMPQLAQRFPKEIAFGPGAARVAFWSGRSARELDFRALTLMHEYWQKWATDNYMGEPRAPGGPMALASHPSNAQGAARTHDMWLLPRTEAAEEPALSTRARAASHPPLLYADPHWLSETGAIGWPLHPKDAERFPEIEEMIETYWNAMMGSYFQLRSTGFIEWGKNQTIGHAMANFRRISRMVDYGLRRHVWGLFARSGQRPYWEYGSRFNRFAGDWELAHWTGGDKTQGMFAGGNNDLPFYWGSHSKRSLFGGSSPTGHTIIHWLIEYYMTGDEYALELTDLIGDAYLNEWDKDEDLYAPSLSELSILGPLYSKEWDEDFRQLARYRAEHKIDLDNPTGVNDEIRHGSGYKLGRDLVSIYDYYRTTGDASARQAILQGVDYMYRFDARPHSRRFAAAVMGSQNYIGILFSIAYQWTKNPNYLRVINNQYQIAKSSDPSHITVNQPFTFGIPAVLSVIAKVDEPIDPFPVLSYSADDEVLPILFEKEAGRAVHMSVYLRLEEGEDEDAAPEVVVESGGSEIDVETEVQKAFRTRNPGRRDMRGRHVSLNVPARAPEGGYTLRLPNAERVVVLDSDAADTRRADEEDKESI